MKGNLTPLDYAYRLLSQRAYSAHDLAAKMRGKGFTPQAVEQAVARLTTQGYLNDTKLAADMDKSFAGQRLWPNRYQTKISPKGT